MKEQSEPTAYAGMHHPFVIIGCNGDTGKVAQYVTGYLIKKLNGSQFATIEPTGFFPLEGVSVDENCIQFPESIFYTCRRKDILLFQSDQPENDHYKFLNTFFETAEQDGMINEIYTINSIISQKVHTAPRRIFAVFNSAELRDMLMTYDLDGLTWEGAPALSSFLLWMAWKKGIPGLSLWVEVPFYLAAVADFQAIKLILSFFNQRFNFDLVLDDIDKETEKQNEKLETARNDNPEVNKYFGLLESGLGLNDEIKIKLSRDVYSYLKNNE